MESITRGTEGRGAPAEGGLSLPEKILDIVLRHRRLIPEHQHLSQSPTPSCRAPHLAKVELAVRANVPIHFILPAFPGKSSNRRKTLTPLPDMGERLALSFLQSLCDRIQEVYAPGARITICSDGRVFSDLVLIEEHDVDAYKRALVELLADIGATSLEHFDLDDLYRDQGYDVAREDLLVRYGTPLRELRQRIREGDPDARTMFNGIHRFMLEDYASVWPQWSRNQQRETTKTIAYRVIQRSNAWSRLVESRFPRALRLSIHPQRADSRKIGIALLPCTDVWGTPWHNVAVLDSSGAPSLMHRARAEALGAELVSVGGRPSHYVLPASLTS